MSFDAYIAGNVTERTRTVTLSYAVLHYAAFYMYILHVIKPCLTESSLFYFYILNFAHTELHLTDIQIYKYCTTGNAASTMHSIT